MILDTILKRKKKTLFFTLFNINAILNVQCKFLLQNE